MVENVLTDKLQKVQKKKKNSKKIQLINDTWIIFLLRKLKEISISIMELLRE